MLVMIEPTPERVQQARSAYRTSQAFDVDGQMRDVVAAVLAVVEREVLQPAIDRAEYAGHERGWRERGERDAGRCPEQRGHVYHPLAKEPDPGWSCSICNFRNWGRTCARCGIPR